MHNDTGTILKLYQLRENSLIVVWLTARHGIIKTVAQGAHKPSSAFRGNLDLFFLNELNWRSARQGDLHHLATTSVINHRLTIRDNYNKLSLASYFSKLILQTVETGTAAEGFHDLLTRAMAYLESSPATLRALYHFEKQLAMLHGIANEGRPSWQILHEHFGNLPRLRKTLTEILPGQ